MGNVCYAIENMVDVEVANNGDAIWIHIGLPIQWTCESNEVVVSATAAPHEGAQLARQPHQQPRSANLPAMRDVYSGKFGCCSRHIRDHLCATHNKKAPGSAAESLRYHGALEVDWHRHQVGTSPS